MVYDGISEVGAGYRYGGTGVDEEWKEEPRMETDDSMGVSCIENVLI